MHFLETYKVFGKKHIFHFFDPFSVKATGPTAGPILMPDGSNDT